MSNECDHIVAVMDHVLYGVMLMVESEMSAVEAGWGVEDEFCYCPACGVSLADFDFSPLYKEDEEE